jgi:hypothetical protein
MCHDGNDATSDGTKVPRHGIAVGVAIKAMKSPLPRPHDADRRIDSRMYMPNGLNRQPGKLICEVLPVPLRGS